MPTSPNLIVVSCVVWLIGAIAIHLVIRYRVWLSMFQRALIMAGYCLLVCLVTLIVGSLLYDDWRFLTTCGIPAGIVSLLVFVTYYLGEWRSLRRLKRHRARADRQREKGNWQSASFHEVMFERLLPLLGKLTELKKRGFLEEEGEDQQPGLG